MTSQCCLSTIQTHLVNWGRGPVVVDLSQSNCIENCHMQKEHLTTICQKLWPRMKHLFVGTRTSIKCHNQYNTHFETGIIILLYSMSHPWHLCPDMDHELKMRKSKLSSIICMLSTALHQFATPYLNDATLWLCQMPYYAMLIQQKWKD